MPAVLKSTSNLAIGELSTVALAERLMAAKQAEDAAKADRIAAEEALIEALAFSKQEGSETFKLGDIKVVVTGKLTRSVDWEMYDTIAPRIPELLQPVKWERKLDEKGLKYLIEHESKIAAMVAKAVTVKPAKTAVTVTRTA